MTGITRRYDSRSAAVCAVDLVVADGEIVAILGPSGCGKSTLLRLIAGLERADEGEIIIGGRRVNEIEPRDRDVAMVFQSYALYPHMTAFENVATPLRLRGIHNIADRVAAAAGRLGITGILDRTPRQLSGGERQRVALARALVREPLVFLLDEPLSNLDALLRECARSELKALFRQLRGTVVYVTHDQTEAMTLADRVAVMRAGRIEQVGAPEEIYRQPGTRFVAEFVGSPRMNLVDTDQGSVGVRPEDVDLGLDGEEAEVVLRESMGAHDLLTVRRGDRELRAHVRAGSALGTMVRVRIDPTRVHAFDVVGKRCAVTPAHRAALFP